MTLNLRHLLFVMMLFVGSMGRGASPHGAIGGGAAPVIEAPVEEGESGTDFKECCYGEKGKVPQLEAALNDPNLPQDVKTELKAVLDMAKAAESEGNAAVMEWFHYNSKRVFSEEDGKQVVNVKSLSEWKSSPPPSPTNGIITTPTVPPPVLPQPPLPGPVPDTPSVATAPTPPSPQAPTPLNPPNSELAQNPHTDRPFLFPERDPLSALKPWPIQPLPQMPERPGQPENPEGRLVWAPKPTPAPPMAINIPALPAIAQRPDPVLPEVLRPETFRATSPPASPAPVQNTTQNFFSGKSEVATASPSPVPPPKPLVANQALAQPQPAPAAAAPPAQAAPLAAAAEAAPSVVVISQAAAPQQSAFLQKNPESEKLSIEKNNFKSEGGTSPSAGVVLTQNTQQAASSPAPENVSAAEVKALSANKKASKFLPDFSSAFGRLKEILHAKKTGTVSAATHHALSQKEKAQNKKDPWAVERSPSSWESNAGGLEAVEKGRSLIHFSSLQVGAGMAIALGALMAFVGWFFYTRQMKNRKPTWVEVIIDHPSLRKRPTRKVKSLSQSPK